MYNLWVCVYVCMCVCVGHEGGFEVGMCVCVYVSMYLCVGRVRGADGVGRSKNKCGIVQRKNRRPGKQNTKGAYLLFSCAAVCAAVMHSSHIFLSLSSACSPQNYTITNRSRKSLSLPLFGTYIHTDRHT